jgi:sterol 24-C-methyltransferase
MMNGFSSQLSKIKIPQNMGDFLKQDRNDQLVFVGVAGASVVASLALINTMYGTNPIGRTWEIMTNFATQEKKRKIDVNDMINQYNDLHDDSKHGLEGRNTSYTTLVNAYYELATLFYEWGWGQCFHFAYQLPGETFKFAIARHEYYLAGRLGLKAGDKVLDCGCGIGGPMRNIARFTNAIVTGVTLNEV